MRLVPTEYQPGGAWGVCGVCGFKTRLNALKLRWDGVRTCAADWDPRPDTMRAPAMYPEGLPRADASPEPPDTFIQTTVRPEDL